MVIADIYGPHQIRMQAHMVPIVADIASIFGPILNQDCMHTCMHTCIWSPSLPKLQAYLGTRLGTELVTQDFISTCLLTRRFAIDPPKTYISSFNVAAHEPTVVVVVSLVSGES